MKPTRITHYLAIAMAAAFVSGGVDIAPATAQEPVFSVSTCVEAPASAVNASRRRAGSSTNCDASARRAEAIRQARGNAAIALSPTCIADLSPQEQQNICAARGLQPRPANAAGDMRGFQEIPGSPDGNIATAFPIAATSLCTVVRDLPAESTSVRLAAQVSGLGDCLVFEFPFITSVTRTLLTARARARCGVQCQ
jgi:uncharacterized protein (DUF849 family)